MKIGSTLIAPNRDIFLQARKDKNATEPTERGLKQAGELLAQYGSERKVVVAGEVAVALKGQTFGEMVQKFGEAKEVKKGIYTFNMAGSSLISNWYKTAMEDEGYGAADQNRDGLISYRESFAVKIMIDFDVQGRVFLDNPREGEMPDDDNIYISVNDAVERDISSDTDKDGVISSSEVKAKEGHDIDKLREEALAASGQAQGADADRIRDKLLAVKKEIEEMLFQGIERSDPKLKRLQIEERRLISHLEHESGYRPVSEKA